MTLLIVLTVVEILVLVAALAYYLVRIARSLSTTASLLSNVSFGVRAIETQCEPIGPAVTRINSQLESTAGAFGELQQLAERTAAGNR